MNLSHNHPVVFAPFSLKLPRAFLLGLYFCLFYPSNSETAFIPASNFYIGIRTCSLSLKMCLPVDFDLIIVLILVLRDCLRQEVLVSIPAPKLSLVTDLTQYSTYANPRAASSLFPRIVGYGGWGCGWVSMWKKCALYLGINEFSQSRVLWGNRERWALYRPLRRSRWGGPFILKDLKCSISSDKI